MYEFQFYFILITTKEVSKHYYICVLINVTGSDIVSTSDINLDFQTGIEMTENNKTPYHQFTKSNDHCALRGFISRRLIDYLQLRND